MSIYVAAFALSYLIGSFPTAYFVVKRNTQKDIRSLGSGNVGGMNAYEVTGNKFVGILVVGIDALKGIVVVLAVKLLLSSTVDVVIVGMTAGIIGHCYPVWLKFHGGRGLAIAAGMLLVTAWIFVAVWLVMWWIGNKLSKNVHIANVAATLTTPAIIALFRKNIVELTPAGNTSEAAMMIGYFFIAAVILLRHIEPIRVLFRRNDTTTKLG